MKTFARAYRTLTLALLLSALQGVGMARAELVIDITRGNVEPLPIAIPSFIEARPEAARFAKDVAAVVTADLERSGLFRAVDPRAFIERPAGLFVQPNFNNWRVLNAQALVVGQADIPADGQLRVEFRLWDVFSQQALTGISLTTPQENWRAIAHKISDEIYERITGETGYFDSRVVYISETGPPDARIKRLSIMDSDGARHQFLTEGRDLVLTPRFSTTTQEITYLSYVDDQPRVYLFNINTGEQEVLGDFPGMTFAPRFSPDGNSVIMSLAQQGNTDIYVMDLRTRQERRLTKNPAIDTAPSFSPDGRRVVFESDRGGSQQLYIMAGDGSNVQRISFGQGRYGTPVWSPRGDLIAFTKIHEGSFHIGVMRTDGSGERLLTNGFLVEGPTWSPNGRVLMFYRQTPSDAAGKGSTSRLFSIDLTGFNEHEVITPLDGSDPAWSPLIQ